MSAAPGCLSHSPGEIGTYFGLTGTTMNGPDAIYARFADAVVPSREAAGVARSADQGAPGTQSGEVRALIDGFATGETAGPVAAKQADIDRLFGHDRMEDIVAALKRDGSELAQSALKTLSEKSPRGMVVTLKLLRLARKARHRWKSAWCGSIVRRWKYSAAMISARACAPP